MNNKHWIFYFSTQQNLLRFPVSDSATKSTQNGDGDKGKHIANW